jgi:hypothetical protein
LRLKAELVAVLCLAACLTAMGGCTFDSIKLRWGTEDSGLDAAADQTGGAPVDVGGKDGGPSGHDAGDVAKDASAILTDAAFVDSSSDGSSAMPDAASKLAIGVDCTQASQCERGFCVDGVCCETACTSMCTTCNLTGNAGYCSPVFAGQDPKGSCAQDLASTCGRDGTCDGSGGCRLWPSGTECASAACTAGTATTARTCDGAGTCRSASSKACAPYACKGTTCSTQCSGNSDCDAGSPTSAASYCSGGTCLRRKDTGWPCTSAIQCAAGNYCNLGLQWCAGAVCTCPASCPYSCISNDGYACSCP